METQAPVEISGAEAYAFLWQKYIEQGFLVVASQTSRQIGEIVSTDEYSFLNGIMFKVIAGSNRKEMQHQNECHWLPRIKPTFYYRVEVLD